MNEDTIEAIAQVEQVYGTVQCDHCRYWGRMDGYIDPNKKQIIQFVCPQCSSIENVANPEFKQ